MSRAPIFIGGMFKSGTTLLRAMLGHHSAIASGLETYWFDWDWAEWKSGAMGETFDRLAGYFDLECAAVIQLAAEAESAEAFLDVLMAAVAKRAGKPRWVEKTPGNIAHVDRIWATWPGAQVIQIVRDPRDVFASLVEARKWDTPEAFAVRWCATVGTGEALVAQFRPDADRYYVLRYEDLISDPEAAMRGVLGFLGEPWEEAVASFEGKKRDFDQVLAATGKASTDARAVERTVDGTACWHLAACAFRGPACVDS